MSDVCVVTGGGSGMGLSAALQILHMHYRRSFKIKRPLPLLKQMKQNS